MKRSEEFLQNIDRVDCWLWVGKSGLFHGIAPQQASFELFVGPLPKKWKLARRCENYLCVNPRHLKVIRCGKNKNMPWSPVKTIAGVRECLNLKRRIE